MISKDLEGNEYAVTASDLTWRPSAYGIIIRDGRILLVKENSKFHLPGGGVDIGENPKAAVIREVREETGVTGTDAKLIDMVSSFFSYGANDNPPNLKHVQSLMIYYMCTYASENSNDVKLDDYEKSAGLVAEWVEVSKLNDIPVGTTVDWRPLVASLQ